MTTPEEIEGSPDEGRFHGLFAALREHVVELTGGLLGRVEAEIAAIDDDDDAPALGASLLQFAVETTNLIFGLLGAGARDDDEPPAPAPGRDDTER